MRRWAFPVHWDPTWCCRRPSCSTRTGRKFGATSATSTGRAEKRLSCCRKPAARPNQAEQPPVNGGEAERDEGEAEEILRCECLAEKQAAKQDRDRRHEQGHQQCI